MPIKESSDELNPPAIMGEPAVVLPRPARSGKEYLALAIASCGVGYLPLAPGTFGSLIGVGLYLVLRGLFLKVLFFLAARNQLNLLHIAYGLVTLELVAILAITLIGIWAASGAEKLSGKKDPGKVVIDEVAGQMVALTVVPLEFHLGWNIVLAFLFFRVFDIVKPYPARRLELLEGGLGIMADDIVAGLYTAILVALIIVVSGFI